MNIQNESASEGQFRFLNAQQLQNEISNSTELLLIYFCASWSGSCHLMTPIIDQIKSNAKKRIRIFRVDIDEHPELAASHGVQRTPTLLFYNQQKLVGQVVGVIPASELEDKISKLQA